jgi:hypothetical protein
MSQAHAQKYYDLVAKDPALLESLGEGTKSADEFIARAIAAAKQQGLEFSADEAKEFMASQADDREEGELSDQQLEAVAGGKVTITMPKKCKSGNTGTVIAKGFGMVWAGYSWGWS